MRRCERGQSVVELLIACALLLAVGVAGMSLVTSGFRAERKTSSRTDALVDMRAGIDRLTKELRQALEVETTSTRSSLQMRTFVDGVEQDITYAASAGTLTRTVAGYDAVPLFSGLLDDEVFCYDPPDCVEAAPASSTPPIVKVSVRLEPRLFADGGSVSITTDVHLRNAG